MRRQTIADFLLGFSMFPMSVLFGAMVVLLFRWSHWREWGCITFFALFPLAGAIRTRQRTIIAGQIAGLIFTVMAYFLLRA